MTIKFSRLTGAAADVKELEYISALLQTDVCEVRSDGSISDNDVVLYLRSRFGIHTSCETVRRLIIRDLGGGDEDLDDFIDLMEIVAMLLIPTILKASKPKEELSSELVQPQQSLLQYVLDMILHDTTGGRGPKKLTRGLIREILICYGEQGLAANDDLIDEMFHAASTPSQSLVLGSFAKALTNDIQLYDITNEIGTTTNYHDVFPRGADVETSKKTSLRESDDEWDEERVIATSVKSSTPVEFEKKWTAPAIDLVAGTYRSKLLLVVLWACFAISNFGYVPADDVEQEFDIETETDDVENCADVYEYGVSWSENSKGLRCTVLFSVLRWLFIFIIMSIFGTCFIGLGSIGNDINCRRFYIPFIGMGVLCSICSGVALRNNQHGEQTYLSGATFSLGMIGVLLHFLHGIALLLPKNIVTRYPRFELFLTSQGVPGEVHIKKASAFKLNTMTKNALELAKMKEKDAIMETHFGQALQAFSKAGSSMQDAGGFFWFWRRAWNGDVVKKEGITFSTRLLASNVTQYIVVVFLLLAGIRLTKNVSENYSVERVKDEVGRYVDEFFNYTVSERVVEGLMANMSGQFSNFLVSNPGIISEEDCLTDMANMTGICNLLDYTKNVTQPDGFEELRLLGQSGFDEDLFAATARQALSDAAEDSVDSLYPKESYMVTIPFGVASVVAVITSLSLATTYLPSVASTTMKLRCGIIPTLRDPKFHEYRIAADQVTLLTGSLFWGCLIASVFVGAIVGAIFFFFLWQATRVYAQRVTGALIGIIVVVLIRLLILTSCRRRMYEAFYRKRPAEANIATLALDCTNFALSVGFVSMRLIKLLITASLYVGRIDVPFLQEGVGKLGPLELDKYPHIFRKDILLQEAHRHPYIEVLGVIFMMKLRHGSQFGNRAGSAWRLIFVYALMPWLNTYRIIDKTLLPGHTHYDGDPLSTTRSMEFISIRRFGALGVGGVSNQQDDNTRGDGDGDGDGDHYGHEEVSDDNLSHSTSPTKDFSPNKPVSFMSRTASVQQGMHRSMPRLRKKDDDNHVVKLQEQSKTLRDQVHHLTTENLRMKSELERLQALVGDTEKET